jgi:hypothetical protein
MTMRRTVYLAVLSGVVLGLAAILSAGSSRGTALADSGCNNHSLRGPYGFAVQGQTGATSTGTEPGEIAAAGQIVFDGNGGLTGNEWESFNGRITPITFSGTYIVAADCTGRATVHNGLTATFRLMLVERGQEVNIIESDQGVVAEGQITQQGLERCSNATFRGAYGFAASGSVFASPGNPSEIFDLAVWARIVADGHGHSTQQTSASVNGAYSEANETADYSVNPDCTGSATIHHSNGTVEHVNFVIVERGNEIKFISAEPGAVFAGSMDKQPSDEGEN